VQDRADIEQRKPAAIVQIHIGMGKAGDVSAQIQFRVGQVQDEIVEFEGIGMERKLSGQVERERNVPLRGEQNVMEIEGAEVNASARGVSAVMKRKIDIAAFSCERDTKIADVAAAVSQFK